MRRCACMASHCQFTEYLAPRATSHALADLALPARERGLAASRYRCELATVRGDFGRPARSALANGRTAPAWSRSATRRPMTISHALRRPAWPSIVRAFSSARAGLAHALGALCFASRRTAQFVSPLRAVDARSAGRRRLALAGVTRRCSRKLTTLANVERFSVEPSLLGGDLQSPVHASALGRNPARARVRTDVVVDIASTASSKSLATPRLGLGAARACWARLPAMRVRWSATAVRLRRRCSTRLGVNGIRLLDEIEPGIPLGITLGGVSVPVVTKAGGFGDEGCLKRMHRETALHQADGHGGMSLPTIAITMGDAAGIGPEIIMKALAVPGGARALQAAGDRRCGAAAPRRASSSRARSRW